MALTFTLVDAWDDGKRIHVSGTVTASGNYATGGDTLYLSQFPAIGLTQAPIQGAAWMDGLAGYDCVFTPGAYSDDGAAINSFYSTAFLAATGLSGRNLFGYLKGYVQGAGSLALSFSLPGDASTFSRRSRSLASSASRNMEQFTNMLAERVSYHLSLRNECGRLMVFADAARSLGQARSLRDRARRELAVLKIGHENAEWLRQFTGGGG